MNNIGPKCWPTWLQLSDDCEIMTSCQVCWRIRRWHNGRTRHSPNPEPGKVSQDCLTNGEESAAHSILARSDSLQQRPYTFAQTNLVTSSLFACGDTADHTFRVSRQPPGTLQRRRMKTHRKSTTNGLAFSMVSIQFRCASCCYK